MANLPFVKIPELEQGNLYTITRYAQYDTKYGPSVVIDLNDECRINIPRWYTIYDLYKFFGQRKYFRFNGFKESKNGYSYVDIEFF